MIKRLLIVGVLAATALTMAAASRSAGNDRAGSKLAKIQHIVVIYEENHSFDNLYGGWEGVNGLSGAESARTSQVDQNAVAFGCLKQNDVNLTSPPLPATCTDPGHGVSSAFPNGYFTIDGFIPPTATTCPAPGLSASNGILNGSGLPGGCTRDLVHRFYQEQYQLNNGQQNRYASGSDAVGLTMGVYDTQVLPIYRYLHEGGHPHYAIADDFFQGSFGGSFLNHQWLVAAATPVFAGALNDGSANDLHSVVDANGMPNNYPLYTSPLGSAVRDNALTASCAPPVGRPATPASVLCGDYAVNTIQPYYQPYSPRGRLGAVSDCDRRWRL